MNAVTSGKPTFIGLMYDDAFTGQDPQEEARVAKTADHALNKSINRPGCKGIVDLEYMSKISGLSVDTLISKLYGKAIIQNPAYFKFEPEWNKTKGWILRPNYLSGNIPQKLNEAKAIEARFPGCFAKNIEILRSIMPPKITIDDIYIGLGAPWVPTSVYELFIKKLLDFTETPRVTYIGELGSWKTEAPAEAKTSVLNNSTHGTNRMSAVKIIDKTMNASTLKVYDDAPYYGSSYSSEHILNELETLAAQGKQKVILDRFDSWIRSEKAIMHYLEEKYNDRFVGFTQSKYDGNFLELNDLNPEVSLFQHQKDAIARVVLSDSNVLLAHDVGAGKTYEIIVSVHELKRLGLSDKNLVVVPNNIFSDFTDAHRYLYPKDNIFVISPKDFTIENRNKILKRIRDEDFDAIYMAYSSFDMVVMSKSYWINKMTRQIRELRQAASQADNKVRKRRLNAEADRLIKKLDNYYNTAEETPWLSFDALGIETLFVDEAHNYKNIPFKTSADNVVGMNAQGSKKCREMLEKVHFTKRVIFSTGTPLTNSLADLYALQLYLQPEVLAFRGLNNFDIWMNTFAKRETDFEVKPDSSDIRPVTRFSSFHNLTELMGMFSCVCDFHYTDESKEYLPKFNGYTDIVLKKTAVQEKYIKELSERLDLIHAHEVRRTEDNALKITTDGKKCALDPRLLGLEEPECGKGKITACALRIEELYHKYPGTCQVVFSDLGTPKSGFNVYDALKDELTVLGISADEIAYIHDATTEKAKNKLFKDVNAGKIRVIIGSTSKLGVGVNIQEKLIALHHLSVPWRPSDMVQREGRILRRGNTCEEVFIFRYITEGTFDSYSWQCLQLKQKFVSSFLSGTASERNIEDLQDKVLSYAEIKALAIGNQLIRQRVETANKLERTKMASRQRHKQLIDLTGIIRSAPEEIKRLQERIAVARSDKACYESKKESIPNAERMAFGEDLQYALKGNAFSPKERCFTDYQGFGIYLPANMDPESPFIVLHRENGGRYNISMDCDKLMGYSKKLDYFLDHFEDYIANLTDSVKRTEKKRAEAKADFEQGNTYNEEAKKLAIELNEIDEEINRKREEMENENNNK